MPASKAQKAKTAQRRAELLKLRIAGVPFEDPRILEELGYKKRGNATKDMVRILEAHVAEERASTAVYRQQENERLDTLLAAVWKQATTLTPRYSKDGEHTHDEIDVRAIDTVLRLMDRRAKLNGLDSPAKTELTGADGGPLALSTADPDKLADLMAATSRLDSDQPANSATSTPDEDDEEEDSPE